MGLNSGSDNNKLGLDPAQWEDSIVEKARTVYADAWDLAVETEDEDLFQKVWNNAARLVVDDVLTSLIEKGMMEVSGMDEDGDMTYGLTPAGDLAATDIINERRNDSKE